MSDDIKDIDYEEIKKDKKIRGKILYYMPGQVATILNQHFKDLKEPISESKVRYYTKMFGNILGEEAINKPARFIEQDIEKLKFIVELKNEGMTIKQIQEYTQEVSFDEDSGIQIKETNPLSIQTLAKALMEEQNKQSLELENNLLNKIDDKINILDNKLKQYLILQAEEHEKSNDKLKQDIVVTVDEIITEKTEKLEQNSKEIEKHINEISEKSIQAQQENKKILDEVALTMTDIKETNNRLSEILKEQRKEENKKGSLWTRFKKRINNSDDISDK